MSHQAQPRRPLHATARDLNILRVIGSSGIAGFEQLYQREWAGKSPQTCADRLLLLKRAGWITLHYTTARGGPRERVYALTEAGQAILPVGERTQLRVGLAPKREHKQQLLAQDYRLHLERHLAAQGSRLVDWQDERELKSTEKRRQNLAQRQGHRVLAQECADARAIIAHADGQQQQLEIEIDGHYYGKMLKNKMSDLAALQRPVVYVCLPGRLKAVRAAAAPYPDIQVESL